ncbi:MAG: tRNA pseudouridine(38-40) synthase TruA [Parvularculaceae bacterium]
MPRCKLILEYDGGPFVGWQRQENGPSVQAALEAAAEALCGEKVTAHAAGRTDAGVHAIAMAAHMDLPKDYPANVVRDALNQHLKPAPVAVLSAKTVSDDFHARFSCVARHYRYRIVNRRPPLALEKGRAWRLARPLDADAMHEAAQAFVGKHDFSTFRDAQCQAASPVKTLSALSVTRAGEEVVIECSAPSFLHSQVRAIVGSLAQVGLGRWEPIRIREALEACDRSACGPTAPACGLYFLRADYENA